MNLPTLVSEDQIRPFSYYWEHQIRSAMMLQGRFYALVETFSEANRALAYEQGCRLSERLDIVITVVQWPSPQYRLWVELSSRTDKGLLAKPTHAEPLAQKKVTNLILPDLQEAQLEQLWG